MKKKGDKRRRVPRCIVGLLVLVYAGTARSDPPTPMLSEGTRTLGVSGHLDHNRFGFGLGLDVSAGYFPMDWVEAGAYGALGFRGRDYRHLSLGAYALFYIDRGMGLVPFVGGRLGAAYDSRPGDRDLYAELQGSGGLNYFVTDHAAVGAELAISAATADVYDYGRRHVDWGLRLFTRWYY